MVPLMYTNCLPLSGSGPVVRVICTPLLVVMEVLISSAIPVSVKVISTKSSVMVSPMAKDSAAGLVVSSTGWLSEGSTAGDGELSVTSFPVGDWVVSPLPPPPHAARAHIIATASRAAIHFFMFIHSFPCKIGANMPLTELLNQV